MIAIAVHPTVFALVVLAAAKSVKPSTMQQLNCSSSSQLTDAFSIFIANSAVLGLCFVLGVPGNISVLRILVQRLKENNFTVRLMLSLAVSDLLILLPLPVWIWTFLHDWIFGSVACNIISYVEYWCIYCSVLCVTLMSVQRYMQVLHLQKWAKLGARGETSLLCGIWILSGVLASYVPVEYEVGCEKYGFRICYKKFRNDTDKVVISFVEAVLFMVCFFSLVFFYYRLYRGVNRLPFSSSDRMAKLVMRIVVAFFMFNMMLPISNILVVIAMLQNNQSLSQTANIVNMIARALVFLNSCVNPFLYTFPLGGQQCCSSVTDDT